MIQNGSALETLMKAYDIKCSEILLLRERVSSLEDEVKRLSAMLNLNTHNKFGKKNESSDTNSDQDVTSDDNNDYIDIKKHKRKKRGPRTLDTSDLPRHTVIHDVSSAQNCQCGHVLHVIAKEVSEQLEIIPARYCVIEHIRMKYGCRGCGTVTMAPKPTPPLPKAIAGPSLLTDVILSKYQYHIPLYRQSKIMKSHHVVVSDKTLSNWVTLCGDALSKMYDALWSALKTRYLQVDETPVKILEPNKQGYLWTYFAPNIGQGLVVFELSETRAGSVASNRLKNFKGLLQTDGYAGYTALRKKKEIVGLGCITHARRKFHEVIKAKADQHDIAAEMLERLKPLYVLEARLKSINATHRVRKKFRQTEARPILNGIYKWLISVQDSVSKKGMLGRAITYTMNQWPYIRGYLKHGMAEIDTNYVENKIREIALGKKNWLFMGNKRTGKIHALFYSLILSAIINDLNPRLYLHYLLTKVHDLRLNKVDPINLLPDRISVQILKDFGATLIEFGRQIFDSS